MYQLKVVLFSIFFFLSKTTLKGYRIRNFEQTSLIVREEETCRIFPLKGLEECFVLLIFKNGTVNNSTFNNTNSEIFTLSNINLNKFLFKIFRFFLDSLQSTTKLSISENNTFTTETKNPKQSIFINETIEFNGLLEVEEIQIGRLMAGNLDLTKIEEKVKKNN